MRESIDVLTLSATPIPRTMQMGLSGVRDMSLILTPPDDRRPVEVHVGEWDPDVVSDAIRREMARGGQIYYVSNRVRSIDEAVKRGASCCGEARVGVAHGKMTKNSWKMLWRTSRLASLMYWWQPPSSNRASTILIPTRSLSKTLNVWG